MRDANGWDGAAFDRWLTTDTMGEAAEAEAERLIAAWEEFVATTFDERDAVTMLDADDDRHPEHAIYAAWLRLQELLDERQYRLEAEEEAKFYAEAEAEDRRYEAAERGDWWAD